MLRGGCATAAMKEIKLAENEREKTISLSANKGVFVIKTSTPSEKKIDKAVECQCKSEKISSDTTDCIDTHFGHQSRDALLDGKIDSETYRAKEAEKALGDRIDAIGKGSVDDVLVDGESVVDGAIAKIDLAGALKPVRDLAEKESARAQKEEESILVKLEKVRSSLAGETNRSIAKDEALERKIAVNASDISSVVSSVKDLEAADEKLQANIDKKQDKLTAGTLIEIVNNEISTSAEKNVIDGIAVNGEKLPLVDKITELGKLSLKDEIAESDLNSTLLDKLNYITSVSEAFEVSNGNLSLKSVSTDLLENGAEDLILDAGGGLTAFDSG